MSVSSLTAAPAVRWWKPLLFLAVVVIGLWLVKWQPYYGKALLAAETHNIGHSLLADVQDHPLQAAWRYAQIYFLAVWKAAVLGIILGSLIQVLIPRRWLITLFGKGRFSGKSALANVGAGYSVRHSDRYAGAAMVIAQRK